MEKKKDQDRDHDREDHRKSSNNKSSSSLTKKTEKVLPKYSPADVKKILGTPNTTQKLQERLKLLKPSIKSSTIKTEADVDNVKNAKIRLML